jgi:hypothetical protein
MDDRKLDKLMILVFQMIFVFFLGIVISMLISTYRHDHMEVPEWAVPQYILDDKSNNVIPD